MKNTALIFSLILTAYLPAFSQEFYYVDNIGNIYTYDLNSCENAFVVEIEGSPAAYGDITFAPDGNAYVVEGTSLYRLDISSGAKTLLTTTCGNIGLCAISALVSDADGNIYMGSEQLYSYNIYSGLTTFHGNFPTGIIAAGDLTFRNDSLFMAAYFNHIVHVDIENPTNSQIHFTYPDSLPIIFGISTFFFDCDSLVSFGSGADDQFYSMDFNTGEIVSAGCTAPSGVFGLATFNEWQASDCELAIDLDGDDSSLSMGPMTPDGFYQTACANEYKHVVDEDVEIQTDYVIDSITIEILPHPFSVQDYMTTFNNHPEVDFSHIILDQKAKLTNLGAATTTDFEEALREVVLFQVVPYTASFRQIQVVIFANEGMASDTVLSQIHHLPGPQVFSLGMDTVLCTGEDLELMVPSSVQYQVDTFSFGELMWQDGSQGETFTVTAPGTYFADFTWEEAFGCTWADTIEVEYSNGIATSDSVYVCEGSTFFFDGNEYLSDTVLCATMANIQGCDSTHCIHLFFQSFSLTSIDTSICQGQNIEMGGQFFSNTGVFSDTLTGSNGCDSIIILDLSLFPTDTFGLEISICESDTFFLGGQVFTVPGVYFMSYLSQNACDSIVELDLTVSPVDTVWLDEGICAGDSVEVGGMAFSSTGFYEVQLTSSVTGCDSLVMLELEVAQIVTSTVDTSICTGESIIFAGQALIEGGIYQDTIGTSSGCDSVVSLSLEVLPLPSVSIGSDTDTCGGMAQLTAATPASFFEWSNGETSSSIQITQPGIYSVVVTDDEGCTGDAYTNVGFPLPLTASLIELPPICHDSEDVFIEVVDIEGGSPPYDFYLDDNLQNGALFGPLPPAGYTVSVEDGNGCSWEMETTIVSPPPFTVDAGNDLTIQSGETAVLEASASAPADSTWWSPPEYLDCSNCPTTGANPPQSIAYQVFATDANGCTASDEVMLSVVNPTGIYAPNIFSPNGDGINDYFTLYSGNDFAAIVELSIFDRWGGMVFYAKNLPPGEEAQGWDGTFRGEEVGQGVYTWFAKIEPLGGEILFLEGGVHLLR